MIYPEPEKMARKKEQKLYRNLVWGFCCQAVSERSFLLLAFLIGFFVRPGIPFLRPDPQYWKAGARRSCQGWPSHQPFHPALRLPGHTLTAPSTAARSMRSG